MEKMEKRIMKKFAKIITLVVVLALCVFSAYTPVAINGLSKLVAAAENQGYAYTAPTQNVTPFTSEAVDTYDLSSWTQSSERGVLSQQVTATTNSKFHEAHINSTLSDVQLNGRSPYVIATETDNVSGFGYYTTDAITLPANGYYMIAVEYCLKDQVKNAETKYAFGTFYLTDTNGNTQALALNAQGWRWATFYIHTDLLESASVTPELYFGSKSENSYGSIYFNQFKVTAVNAEMFNDLVFNGNELKVNQDSYLDFSRSNDYRVVKTFDHTQFNNDQNTKTASSVPGTLGFSDNQHYFHNKDGVDNEKVMLIAAHNGNDTLRLDNYSLIAQPHQVYMFQFYSIATADLEFSGFYFNIIPSEDTIKNSKTVELKTSSHQITTLSSDKYHNGWQLNTIFFIAGREFDQEYTFSFSLSSSDQTVTGWACIDDFKIYQVGGDYANNNSSATGVHDTFDLNKYKTEPDIANGHFELGTSSSLRSSTYPYPLVSNDWTAIPGTEANSQENGIINLNRWSGNYGSENPGSLSSENNNVFMMRNTTAKDGYNTLVSPALTVTAGETMTVSFDAYSQPNTVTRAWLITPRADDLNDHIKLGQPIEIDTGRWQQYSFTLNENQYAASRSYYILFEMTSSGYTYIDNVTNEETNNANNSIDLTNPISVEKIWQSDDANVQPVFTDDGLTVKNDNGHKTTIQNIFAYNLTKDLYYEFVINARGNNAYLNLLGYDGLLAVDSDTNADYKLYLQVADTTAPLFQIILGSTDEDATAMVGEITINSITVTNIQDADYTAAQETADEHSLFLTQTKVEEEENNDNGSNGGSFFGENWWYLVPTLITAIAALLAITAFLFRKIKFDKHITKKNTSYARDMRLKNQQKKIVAQKAAKVDNVIDETHGN